MTIGHNPMKVLAIASQKGGVGKTTAATNLGVAGALAGYATAILDLDPQATAAFWADSREAQVPAVSSIQASRMGPVLKSLQDAGCDLVLIDLPPNARDVIYTAIGASDFVIIPARPAAFDLHAIRHTLEAARHCGKSSAVVLNFVPASGSRADDGAEIVVELGGDVAVARLGDRVAFQHAQAHGLGVMEYDAASKASAEIAELWRFVSGKLGLAASKEGAHA